VAESSTPGEQTGTAVVEESGEETAEIQMEFGTLWHGIDRSKQKVVVERKTTDGGQGGGSERETAFLGIETGNAQTARLPDVTDHHSPPHMWTAQETCCEKAPVFGV
jgi:hypothetical protein